MAVMPLLICTMFLRPRRFMARAAGIESSRNQMKTIEGDESGEGLAEPEILLDIAGRDTDHVAEAHDEETEQDGQ